MKNKDIGAPKETKPSKKDIHEKKKENGILIC